MVDLSAEMADLWASLGAPATGRARVVQLVAARRGAGTSTIARELAFFAASRGGRSVWLIDLDLLASPQSAALAAESARYGALGDAVAATPDGSMFFTVQPAQADAHGVREPDSHYISAHKVGPFRWWVTRFRRDVMRGRQTVHVLPSADFWNSLRRHADVIIVDAPPIDRSQAALTLAPFIDQTVLVVAADDPDIRASAALRDALTEAGGKVAGLFFNRSEVETPGFLKAILP